MYNKIKVFHKETQNNIYQFGFKITAKTAYEQKRERKAEFIYMLTQRLIATLFIICGIIFSFISKEGAILIIALLIGIPVLLTKEHVIEI